MGARERLSKLLSASGMSQAELARRVGEHTTWVNNRLRGVAEIKADDIERLAAGLGVSPSAFFDQPPARSIPTPAHLALEQEPVLAQALSAALLKTLIELSPPDREQLWRMVDRLTRGDTAEERQASRYASKDKYLAERATRRLARAWQDLPTEEQEFVWEMVEARRLLREKREEEGKPPPA